MYYLLKEQNGNGIYIAEWLDKKWYKVVSEIVKSKNSYVFGISYGTGFGLSVTFDTTKINKYFFNERFRHEDLKKITDMSMLEVL